MAEATYTIKEVAQLMKCSESSIRNSIANDKYFPKPIKTDSRTPYRWRKTDFDSYVGKTDENTVDLSALTPAQAKAILHLIEIGVDKGLQRFANTPR
ncbi:hypothetical protein L1285_16670 [Pseudoalteromonas sp. DL2-H2.2]|uniref:helix-turn-helix transcriptional regulator n=1 Tax=Pseudoalteromonas sp. DL2-H2.2 TaxID=2908889 RepID=UPI001F176339|nr:hypothetical protein [Pseudoalteromonas sp. DL2-H2.2]MCF2909957.1 hypothetical protein [Pseudoalteromonas sp. DL2-H2.2]